ncbi:unnamed protein product [Sympodiomycopsis kandeliae]
MLRTYRHAIRPAGPACSRPILGRTYATPMGKSGKQAPPAPSPSSSGSQYSDSPWNKPLASTQTMSLFSTSPSALLFALEQSLRGALGALVRADPQGTEKFSTDPRDYLLLFAVDKTLPSEVLAEATRLCRDIPIPHIGVLGAPIPGNLLPESALHDAQQQQQQPQEQQASSYHSVSLSLLPKTLARPFYSDIPGVPVVKAGRWASGKPVFEENDSRVGHLDEADQTDWRSIWGKENVHGKVPDAMKGIDASKHLTTLILGSDHSPQGLLEGVDSKFTSSSLLGSIATNTFFETGGRESTMFYRGEASDEARIYDKGAVGLYLTSQAEAAQVRRPNVNVSTPFTNFTSLGIRREITRAKGNIISELSNSNACQHFLRDVAAQDKSSNKSEPLSLEAKARGMNLEEQRLLSKGVKKEEEFWAAIWSSSDHTDTQPKLFVKILSGHPSRGTISLDTDLELSTGLESVSSDQKIYLEFFKASSTPSITPLEIPGKDLSAWRLPRFLFLTSPPSNTTSQEEEKGKAAVHALPNLFVLASENGVLSRDPSAEQRDNEVLGGGKGYESLKNRSKSWKATGTTAVLDLRGRSSA